MAKNKTPVYCFFILMAVMTACTSRSQIIETFPFGKLSTREDVTLYRLKNSSGSSVDVIDYGCRIVGIQVPDRNGVLGDVVQGYDNINDFEFGKERFFGALLGRYCNRIANGRFKLDSLPVQLTCNENFNDDYCGHLHGGENGFDRVMWKGELIREQERVGVKFRRISPDGEEGYPGNLDCTVTYWWSQNNILKIEYKATTDEPTIVNLSNHTYFNLKSTEGSNVMDHVMVVEADKYLPDTAYSLPKGPIKPVEGTLLDLRKPQRVGDALDIPGSITWVLRNQSGTLAKAADLWEPDYGRGIETWTTEPGLLTYIRRGVAGPITVKEGKQLAKYGCMLLESLHFPDSPNHPEYPSTVLYPGQLYSSTTEFRFYTK